MRSVIDCGVRRDRGAAQAVGMEVQGMGRTLADSAAACVAWRAPTTNGRIAAPKSNDDADRTREPISESRNPETENAQSLWSSPISTSVKKKELLKPAGSTVLCAVAPAQSPLWPLEGLQRSYIRPESAVPA